MRIGLDARTMTQPRPHGTGRNLLDAYRLMPALRPDWEFILYHQRSYKPASDTGREPWHHPNVHLCRIDMPGDRFDAWFQLRLPLATRSDCIDLLHLPANAAPRWCPVPCIATIHDLVPLVVPGEYSPRETATFRRGVSRATHHAGHLITPSVATRDSLVETFDVNPNSVSVIPWAADQRIAAEAESLDEQAIDSLRDRYDLGPRWLVTFAGDSRRKNAVGVLEALSCIKPAFRRKLRVVLVGCEPESCHTKLRAIADRLGLHDHCRILGFVSHNDLTPLLTGSCGLLIPSLCEGFGLPVLDAFACGVPVLASGTSSLPEVAGDAAVYCDPNDPHSIAGGIESLLDTDEAERLVALGHERLKLFTWECTAEAMCTAYERALASAKAPGSPVLESCPQ